jgi:hypothetical protein
MNAITRIIVLQAVEMVSFVPGDKGHAKEIKETVYNPVRTQDFPMALPEKIGLEFASRILSPDYNRVMAYAGDTLVSTLDFDPAKWQAAQDKQMRAVKPRMAVRGQKSVKGEKTESTGNLRYAKINAAGKLALPQVKEGDSIRISVAYKTGDKYATDLESPKDAKGEILGNGAENYADITIGRTTPKRGYREHTVRITRDVALVSLPMPRRDEVVKSRNRVVMHQTKTTGKLSFGVKVRNDRVEFSRG